MTSAIFLPEASLPALDGGVDRRYTKSFSFLVGLSLSLTDAGAVLVPPGSTTEMVQETRVEGNGNPLHCSCLENPRDGGAWWAAVYGVTQSRTRLNGLSSSSR